MPHRPRARRYPFVASIELTDTESEEQVWGQTTEVSLFGWRVEKVKLLPPNTKVSIRIVHLGHSFLALGRVVYARGGIGSTCLRSTNPTPTIPVETLPTNLIQQIGELAFAQKLTQMN